MSGARTLPWDWYPGTIPENVVVDETAYIETTFSFALFRSRQERGVTIGRGASTYLGTMFDAGPRARIDIGEYTLIHGARIICDAQISIGAYSLISWNVVLMDSYRLPLDRHKRRIELERVSRRPVRAFDADVPALPIHIGRNVWIGFDACVLPGVTVGEGAVIGARSVVMSDVPAYTVVAGNPAQVIRKLEPSQAPASSADEGEAP
jgi:acetyltransferase-like isoleucine patch superfamily enzyme